MRLSRFRTTALVLAALLGCKEPAPAPPVAAGIAIAPSAPQLEVGGSVMMTAAVVDQHGDPYTAKAVSWRSDDPTIASVNSVTGFLTGHAAGTVRVSVTVDGLTAAVTAVVTRVPVAMVVVNSQPIVPVGQTTQATAVLADRNGNPATDRIVTWTSSAQDIATVDAGGLVRGIAPGTAQITATSEGVSGTRTITVTPPPPQPTITSVSPATLVPGATATLTGRDFGITPGLNTVSVGGVPAQVLTASETQLTIVVPCVAGGTTSVQVVANGVVGTPAAYAIATPRRTLAPGEAFIATSPADALCNELPATNGDARYLVAVFNGSAAANALTDFVLAGSSPAGAGAAPAPRVASQRARPTLRAEPGEVEQAARERRHLEHLEAERSLYRELRTRARAAGVRTAGRTTARTASRVAPPAVGDMRTIYYSFGNCTDTSRTIPGRAIYVGRHAVIWEDTTNTLRSTSDPALAEYYTRIGRIFDEEQYASIKETFGDPLLRDAETDNDGLVHMVFSRRLNGSGAAAFVTSCDQVPRNVAGASNHGQFFYGMAPTTPGSNVNSTSFPDGWFYFMARTVIHEVKHIASHSARWVNDAAFFEQSWLEEGTARHAEEVWIRKSLHKVPWKGNTGWVDRSTNGVYCDFHPEDAACNAADPLRRPGYGMRRHFNEIREKLLEPWNWSPYGDGLGQQGSVFYQTTWSLVRYAIDRYGSSDAAFLTALNQSVTTGTTNLAAVAGVPMDRLLGGWALALVADDYPGLASPSADIQFPTWNLRSIYGGLSADANWGFRWSTPYPIAPAQLQFGSFAAQQDGVRGGAFAYYEISGVHARSQLLSLRSPGGAAPSSTLRIAIARLQ